MPKSEQQELSEEAVQRITRVIRSLPDDRVDRGIDLSRPLMCDSCGLEKPPGGGALYGSYKLCNDCLLDLTLSLASGTADTVADFMTMKTEDPNSVLSPGLEAQRDRSSKSLSVKPLTGRDKLMPSNEPC